MTERKSKPFSRSKSARELKKWRSNYRKRKRLWEACSEHIYKDYSDNEIDYCRHCGKPKAIVLTG